MGQWGHGGGGGGGAGGVWSGISKCISRTLVVLNKKKTKEILLPKPFLPSGDWRVPGKKDR